jgi:hypothetical protein
MAYTRAEGDARRTELFTMRITSAERARIDRLAKRRGLAYAADLVRRLLEEEEARNKFWSGHLAKFRPKKAGPAGP